MPPHNASAHVNPPVSVQVRAPRLRAEHAFGALRLSFGALFFWAFLDKLFGLRYATARENAWVRGGSPTNGFLSFGTDGPFASFYQGIAGNAAVDALFMGGLALIGAALLLGIGVRVASYAGALLVLMMWSAHLPPENHPFLDDHVLYAFALVALGLVHAGRTFGLGRWWGATGLVRRYAWLE